MGGQLDKVQMRQTQAAAMGMGTSAEVQRHREALDASTEERNRLATRLEALLRDAEKEKAYHEQSLERVMQANGRLLEEKDRATNDVQRLSQLYADSVRQLQGSGFGGYPGRSDSLVDTSSVFRADSVDVDSPVELASAQE